MVRTLFDVSEPPKAKTTWLTPYWTAWREAVGGNPSSGELSQRMKRLEKEHGPAKVLAHFTRYLLNVDVRYASLKRFEETFGQHGGTSLSATHDPRGNLATAQRILDRLGED